MMKGKKHIIINQRIPVKVLNDGLSMLFKKDALLLDDLKVHLHEYFQGENRITKAAQYSMHILSRPKILPSLRTAFNIDTYNLLSDFERNAIILNLIAQTYPIAYDLLIIMGKIFKVQKEINRATITTHMSSIYGNNRSLYNALDALLPMLIELKLIKRARVSIYEIEARRAVKNPFISELYIYTDIKLSGSKTILLDDLQFRPGVMYFEPVLNLKKMSILKHSEGRVGGGYVGAIQL